MNAYTMTRHGVFKSSITGKEYAYVKDPDGSSKRAALRSLENDHREIIAAAQARADAAGIKRRLTLKEVRDGFTPVDQRSPRERVAQDATWTERPQRGPDFNPHRERAEFLENRLAHARPGERAGLRLRLELAKRSADKKDAEIEAQMAHEAVMAMPGVDSAIVYGNASLCLLKLRHDARQEWINRLAGAIDELKRTGDTDAFYAAHDAIAAERAQLSTDRADALSSQAAELKAQAAELRRDKSGDRAIVAAINAAQEGSSAAT
jgi:hypothetical protein